MNNKKMYIGHGEKWLDEKPSESVGFLMYEKLRVLDGDCFMAGGACRDMLEGKKPNDYDYYFYVRGLRTIEQTIYSLEAVTGLSIVHKQKTMFMGAYAEHNPLLQWVFEGKDEEGNIYQFMLLHKPATTSEVLSYFPLSNCKVWMEWGYIHKTKDYEIGEKHGVIFKTYAEYSEENPYIQKIRKRYPDVPYFSSKDELVNYLLLGK